MNRKESINKYEEYLILKKTIGRRQEFHILMP